MATILEVKVDRVDDSGHTHYDYPPEYDADKIQVIAYEDADECQARANKNNQLLIGVVKDKDASQFLESSNITELTQSEAREKGNRWRPQTEQITDQQKVLKIIAKGIRKSRDQLTKAEKDALDPQREEKGISMSRGFDSHLDEYLNKW